jgi:hypothetical protein
MEPMRQCVLALVLTGLCMAGDMPKTYTGVVHDNKCVGPECATLCAINKNPVYTLQVGNEAFVLSDAKKSAPYTGKTVTVTATPMIGNKLRIISIAAAR